MDYSFTERMRLRKNFAKRRSTHAVPYLLAMQLESYARFLQEHTSPEARIGEGLQSAFQSMFPIESYSGNARLEFVSYHLGESSFDERECRQRGLTYALPLRVKIRLILMDKDAVKPTIKEVKEQEIHMGEIPRMTNNGSFIINGTERVVVSQLHRSPGVFFESNRDKTTRGSGKLLYSARIIPYRGSWLDFEFDTKDYLYFRIDKRRKMPITTLLKALGLTTQDIVRTFYDTDTFQLSGESISFSLVLDRLRGELSPFAIYSRKGELLLDKNKRVTTKHIKDIEKSNTDKVDVPKDFLLGKFLAEDVVDASSGEVIAQINEEITDTLLKKIQEAGVGLIRTLYVNDLNNGDYIARTLRMDDVPDQYSARVAIYRMMRPGEPPTEDTVEALFRGLFFDEARYDLSRVGRMKFNRRVFHDVETDENMPTWLNMFYQRVGKRADDDGAGILSNEDILAVLAVLIELRNGRGDIDDIDSFG